MAVVWAKQAGNWSDTTLWAFWNENTQQIEDYGQVPQPNDVVYLNNYKITSTDAVIEPTIDLHNDTNPYTLVEGGYLSGSFARSFRDIHIGTTYIFRDAYGTYIPTSIDARTIYITDNGGLMLHTSGNSININANIIITAQNTSLISRANINVHGTWSVYINGNVYTEGKFIGSYSNFNQEYTYIIINGNLTLNCTRLIAQAIYTTTINGDIFYSNVDAFFGLVETFNLMTIAVSGCAHRQDVGGSGILVTDYQLENEEQYPAESNVKKDVPYAFGQMTGIYQPNYPPESVVLKDYEYGDSDDRKTGTMEQEVNVEVGCVTPEDVRKDVPLVGMGVVGSLVVPSVDDVREGVVFDNGSVGTLIVEGGGDRLRIADFGYYTNAQSDTYIVDLTEQDKPKFAVAEERVLIEMFPDLDLDNIPEKYFDDLFVKYLKYRLIVEYYRTAGINSTFTPSEPTTEIVNYQNVCNEVWLNSANIYLKAWGKKYPESITKPQRILL